MFSQVCVLSRGVPHPLVPCPFLGGGGGPMYFLRGYPSSREGYPSLWSHVLSQGVPQSQQGEGYPSPSGERVPKDRGYPPDRTGVPHWPGQDWGTPLAMTGLGYPTNQDRIGVPPDQDTTGVPPGQDWGSPPPQLGLGYAPWGLVMPRAVCLLRFPAGGLSCSIIGMFPNLEKLLQKPKYCSYILPQPRFISQF